jgi:hypothetical protein
MFICCMTTSAGLHYPCFISGIPEPIMTLRRAILLEGHQNIKHGVVKQGLYSAVYPRIDL